MLSSISSQWLLNSKENFPVNNDVNNVENMNLVVLKMFYRYLVGQIMDVFWTLKKHVVSSERLKKRKEYLIKLGSTKYKFALSQIKVFNCVKKI